jgi:hypothetical protein
MLNAIFHIADAAKRHYIDVVHETRGTQTMTTIETGRRIPINAWGVRSGLTLPAYAVMTDADYGEPMAAIQRAIRRKTGLHVASIRKDCHAVENGVVTATHYEMTLGSPGDGGYYVDSTIWIAIDVD